MNDANKAAKLADDSASDAGKTDEQLWADIERTEKDNEPTNDQGEGNAPDFEDVDRADEPATFSADDDDPGPSKGNGEATDGDDPAGMEPEALQAQVDRLQHSLDSEKGRSAKSRREIDDLRNRLSAAPLAQQESDDDATLAKERREKLDASREEYGDVIGPLADTITELEARLDKFSDGDRKELERNRERYTTLVKAEQDVFEKEHPDGFDTIKDNRETFNDWIEDQPKALRDTYADNQRAIVDGNQAALLVGKFKQALLDADGDHTPANQETERLQNRRRKQLAGARSIRSTNKQAATSRPHQDSSDDQGHWDYFKRLDPDEKR